MPEDAVKAHVEEVVANNRLRAEKFWDDWLCDIPRNEALLDALADEITAAQRQLLNELITRLEQRLSKKPGGAPTEFEMVSSGETAAVDFPAWAEGDR